MKKENKCMSKHEIIVQWIKIILMIIGLSLLALLINKLDNLTHLITVV